jgi:RNA polymerase sigma-70 factor (ECF subfamily)
MQETFISVMSNAGDYRSDLNGKAWLFSIARNLAISKIRKYRNESPADIDDAIVVGLKEERQLDETVIRSVVLKNALNKLDSMEAQIVILHIVGGLKHKEIGKMLNLSIGTVCSKYFYSLKKLRRFME